VLQARHAFGWFDLKFFEGGLGGPLARLRPVLVWCFAWLRTTTVMSVQDRNQGVCSCYKRLEFRSFRTIAIGPGRSTILCLMGCIAERFASRFEAIGGFAIGAEGTTIAFRPPSDWRSANDRVPDRGLVLGCSRCSSCNCSIVKPLREKLEDGKRCRDSLFRGSLKWACFSRSSSGQR